MSKICFFENTDVSFLVRLNAEYQLTRLIEIEVVITAKNTEINWRWKYPNGNLQLQNTNEFVALLNNADNINKKGEYMMQVRINDNVIGEQKFEIIDVDIHKSIAINESNNFNLGAQLIEIPITVSFQTATIGGVNINESLIRGYSALDLFRIEQSQPMATWNDMMNYAIGSRFERFQQEVQHNQEFINPFPKIIADNGNEIFVPFTVTILDGVSLTPRDDVHYEVVGIFEKYKIKLPVRENNINVELLYIIVEQK